MSISELSVELQESLGPHRLEELEEARKAAEKGKRFTSYELAKLAQCSPSTVSIVLNAREDKMRISKHTAELIRYLVKITNYRVNSVAKALKAQKSNTIGLLIPDFANHGFALTARYLEQYCRKLKLQLLISCHDEDPQLENTAISNLLQQQIDLLITTPTRNTLEHYQVKNFDIPVLQLDRKTSNTPYPYVITDDIQAVESLLTEMISKHQLEEIYFLGGQPELRPSRERRHGYRKALENCKLELQPGWLIEASYHSSTGYRELAKLYQKLGRLPRAIFTGSYHIMEGIMQFLHEHKLLSALARGEMIVATFDDHDILNSLPFHINSIQQNHPEIAKQTFKLICQALKISEAEMNLALEQEPSGADLGTTNLENQATADAEVAEENNATTYVKSVLNSELNSCLVPAKIIWREQDYSQDLW